MYYLTLPVNFSSLEYAQMDDCRNAGVADWPLHRSARQQTAGRRRFPRWFPSLWYVGTGASGGSRSTMWPGPAALTAETATPQALTANTGDQLSVTIRLRCVRAPDQWRPQEAAPRGLCRGTPGRSGTLGRRTGLSRSLPSCPHSSGTETWIWSVHTCTTRCVRTDALKIIYVM